MTQPTQARRPPIVPRRYAGQWIAWDREHSRIVASGRTFAEAQRAAAAAGEADVVLAKVPKAAIRFVGGGE